MTINVISNSFTFTFTYTYSLSGNPPLWLR